MLIRRGNEQGAGWRAKEQAVHIFKRKWEGKNDHYL